MLFALLWCLEPWCQAQKTVEVSKPDLALKGNNIQITYDILNSTRADKFTIRIEITDAEGNTINASSLSGDIGADISGGKNKQILWDIEADSIFLDAEIFVQVFAKGTPPVITIEPPVTEPSTQSYNRTGIILQSVALPGLGLSRINRGQPHWIRGVAGYACIAGAIYFNNKAVSSYEAYRTPGSLSEVDNLFDKAVMQDNLSEALAYSAIGIWIVDIVWTIMGSAKLNDDNSLGDLEGFSIGSTVDPHSNVPLISVRFGF